MRRAEGVDRIKPAWWALILLAVVVVFLFVSGMAYTRAYKTYVPVALMSDRAGLVLDTGAKVMLRGVEVGEVRQISLEKDRASLGLGIDPGQIRYIPANVHAEIKATTVFGTKYVELLPPQNPSPARLAAGTVLHSENISTEVNTVFENVVDLLKQVDPVKLNAVLTAVADAVRGRGQQMGEATSDLNQVLLALNPRNEIFRRDVRSLKRVSDTYATAAQDIITILNAASTTSTTVVKHAPTLDALLLNAIGFTQSGTNLLGANKDNLVASVNTLEPTTNLLLTYNPEYTCLMQGAHWYLDHGGHDAWGRHDGRSLIADFGLSWSHDPYVYPDNLPVVAAKGGPGGKPGCGSLPDVTKNFPVRQLITNTGWGTGLDIRPNPGLGHPCYADYAPVTRGVPQPPSIRQCIPGPAIGPVPYSGAPPYGAPLYGPGGVPLWPGVPPAQPAPTPAKPPASAP